MAAPTPDVLKLIMEVASNLYRLIEDKVAIDLQYRRLELLVGEEEDWDDDTTPVDVLEMYMLDLQILKHKIAENQEAVLVVLPILTGLLEQYGYLNRGVAPLAYNTPKYAVHPDYITAFDDGFYDETTRTWSPAIGEVPPRYALLHLTP